MRALNRAGFTVDRIKATVLASPSIELPSSGSNKDEQPRRARSRISELERELMARDLAEMPANLRRVDQENLIGSLRWRIAELERELAEARAGVLGAEEMESIDLRR